MSSLSVDEIKGVAQAAGQCDTCKWDDEGRCVLKSDCSFIPKADALKGQAPATLHDVATGKAVLAVEGVRQFESGATRSADAGRYDPEGFLSPIVLERFCEYMNKHRLQPDGSIRGSDNWQKGIPLATYAKGMWRHFLHFWTRHRGHVVRDDMSAASIEEDLCAILFNVQGYLFEVLKEKEQSNG
jgi:hypothetical protein